MKKVVMLILFWIFIIVAMLTFGICDAIIKEVHAGEVIQCEENDTVLYNAIYCKETYLVSRGDTLDSIADEYIKKNTYGKREHREFKQGIIELNDWLTKDYEFHGGEELIICYWRAR